MTIAVLSQWLTVVPRQMGTSLFNVVQHICLILSNSSQFYVTFKAAPNLNNKHTVFGKLVGGEEVLDALERLPLKDGTERPAKPVKITEVVMCVTIRLSSHPVIVDVSPAFTDIKTLSKITKHAMQRNSRAKLRPS